MQRTAVPNYCIRERQRLHGISLLQPYQFGVLISSSPKMPLEFRCLIAAGDSWGLSICIVDLSQHSAVDHSIKSAIVIWTTREEHGVAS